MKAEKSIKKLYFIAGRMPNEAEAAEAKALGITAFRRAKLAEGGMLEQADLVAGKDAAKVLERYRSVQGTKIVESKAAEAPVKK